jgi:hypothetical protein
VTEGYKTGPPQAIPTPPVFKHASSSFSNVSGVTGTSYSSSDAGSLRSSTYTNPALSTSSIFLSSSDALSAAQASVRQEQQREREQIALLNSLKPRRDLMCLADVVDVDAPMIERGGFPFRSTVADVGAERPDNYHLHVASRPVLSPDALEEEPYRPERGRKRQTAEEEDEGEATETEESEDAVMEVDGERQATEVSHRPIRGIRGGAQPALTTRALPSRRRLLRTTQSAPVGTLQRSLGGPSDTAMDLEGGLSAWVGRTDF